MDATKPLISIVIPVKNEAKRIPKLIEGLHKQTYRPLEVIFVDGDSTDETTRLITEAAQRLNNKDFTIKLLKEEDYGTLRSPANARNIGALNATGKYIAFFDADFDLSHDEHAIEKIAKAFNEGAVHVAIKYTPNEHTWIERNLALDDIIYYFNGDKPRHELCCFAKELITKNLFNPNLGFREDMEFLSRLGTVPVIVDTEVRRCYPHTVRDVRRQQLWYGRTWLNYMKIASRKKRDVLVTITRMNAIIGLLTLAILTAILKYYILSPLFLLSAFGIIYYRWLRKDIKHGLRGPEILNRLCWLLFREVVGRLFFDIGVIQSLIHKGKVILGRE